ncbi:hypothetical protein HID58_033816 [Brassica napus]|uniref:PPM-type phosphatase domain-containing protein n=1 Tax=Brassica napus TaxID=3708 RepID=A0ABQ8C202_BRANA|nr:hypothetical protein HID58_033816 [Brassica napus]
MMMWISKLAKAVCFVTGLTWKGGHDEAAAATIYLKDTLTTEEQQQLITCLSKDKSIFANVICVTSALLPGSFSCTTALAALFGSNKHVSRRQTNLLTRKNKSGSFVNDGHCIARDQTYTLTEEDEFLIMRCEGIWDVLTSQEEVTELALEASRLNTFDNVSVVVVCFLSADEMVTRLLRRRSNGVVV